MTYVYSATSGTRLGSATRPGLRPSCPWHEVLPRAMHRGAPTGQ